MPKVIDCPDPKRSGKATLSAIAKDGVELRVRTRVTVSTNLEQLIGGATEETIIARVGESIISSIGSCESHQSVLANPDVISRTVLRRGLDAQTAFQIVSIDIADIDVGDNIGARLRADQAEADVRVARALAESRRAEAIATEQENRARVAENRANLVRAEAEVPRAMALAINRGNFGAVESPDNELVAERDGWRMCRCVCSPQRASWAIARFSLLSRFGMLICRVVVNGFLLSAALDSN